MGTEMGSDGRKYSLTCRTPESEQLHAEYQNEVLQASLSEVPQLIAITSTVFDRSSDRYHFSGRGGPAHRNSSVEPYNNGGHATTSGTLLRVESQPEYRATVRYKTARG